VLTVLSTLAVHQSPILQKLNFEDYGVWISRIVATTGIQRSLEENFVVGTCGSLDARSLFLQGRRKKIYSQIPHVSTTALSAVSKDVRLSSLLLNNLLKHRTLQHSWIHYSGFVPEYNYMG
jgi:hypothetical protein